MLQALSQATRQAAQVKAIQAPVRGWNKRDPLSNMKEGFAVILDNWWPLPYSIEFRKGSSNWATAITDEGGPPVATTVNTLIAYRPQSGNQELWAFSGARLFDVSASGDVGASEVSGLSSDQWNCINFATTAGNFLLCVNGLDLLLAYDGTNWEAIDNASSMFTITGVTTSDLINLFVHKSRLYYIEKASMSVWYPAVGALGGSLTELNLSSVFKKGGFLMAGGSWSVDAGDGPDDYAAFITSEGEIAVYAGDNPASTWTLIGIFEVGRPIGRRCLLKYGGDLLVLTVDGILSATAAFQRGREQAKQLAITDVIQGAVAEASALYRDAFGWHMTLFAPASMLLVDVPETSGGIKQWAMNTVTKAWTRFKDWESTCFEVFNDEIYFGVLGAVRKGWTGAADEGESIVAEVLPAFDYYGSKAQTKQWNMIRPTIEWDANPLSITIGFDADFIIETPTQDITPQAASSGAVWDTDTWDSGMWAGDLSPQSEWYTVSAIGLAGAPHLIFESNVSRARITSFDVVYQKGNVFG